MTAFKIGDKVRVFGKRQNNYTTEEGIITKSYGGAIDCWFVKPVIGWIEYSNNVEQYVNELDMELLNRTIDNVREGDQIISGTYIYNVLATIGKTVMIQAERYPITSTILVLHIDEIKKNYKQSKKSNERKN